MSHKFASQRRRSWPASLKVRAMASVGRPITQLELAVEERRALQKLARKRTGSPASRKRARMVLMCAQGLDNTRVAESLDVSPQTVGKWRRAFLSTGLEGLQDKPRSGRPSVLDPEYVERVVSHTLHAARSSRRPWNCRSLAAEIGITKDAVHRIWKAFGMQPHGSSQLDTSNPISIEENSTSPVGLFMSGRMAAFVVNAKKSAPGKATARTPLPLLEGPPESRMNQRRSHSVVSLLVELDLRVHRSVCDNGESVESLITFLEAVDQAVPQTEDLQLVMDNHRLHRSGATRRWLSRHARFRTHFMPSREPWLRWVGESMSLPREPGNGRMAARSRRALQKSIRSFQKSADDPRHAFTWVAARDGSREPSNAAHHS